MEAAASLSATVHQMRSVQIRRWLLCGSYQRCAATSVAVFDVRLMDPIKSLSSWSAPEVAGAAQQYACALQEENCLGCAGLSRLEKVVKEPE